MDTYLIDWRNLMKRSIAVTALFFTFLIPAMGQTQPERRVIEVSGSAERLVTPDEFTFKITLVERIENKQKITIEQQETALRIELARLGVDVAKDLSIFDLSSTYFRQKKVKDVLGTKDYRLKIRDLNKIATLQELADRLNVSRLDLINTEHSEITRLRRETKIDAIKAAKVKAVYLLEAIGQRVGMAVSIKEEPEESPGSSNFANTRTNTFVTSAGVMDRDDGLSFAPIRLRYAITAKFEIE